MWAVWSVLAVCSIFESLVAQNHNETAQNQTDYDIVGSGASFTRNLSASISVSDADSTVNGSEFANERFSNLAPVTNYFNSGKVNIFEEL